MAFIKSNSINVPHLVSLAHQQLKRTHKLTAWSNKHSSILWVLSMYNSSVKKKTDFQLHYYTWRQHCMDQGRIKGATARQYFNEIAKDLRDNDLIVLINHNPNNKRWDNVRVDITHRGSLMLRYTTNSLTTMLENERRALRDILKGKEVPPRKMKPDKRRRPNGRGKGTTTGKNYDPNY